MKPARPSSRGAIRPVLLLNLASRPHAVTFGCFSCMTLGGKDPQSDGEFVHFECYSGG